MKVHHGIVSIDLFAMPAPSTVFLVETLLLFISAILSCHGHTHQHSISPPLLMADPAIPSAVRVAFTLESPLLMDTPHLLLTFSFNSSLCKSSPPLTGLVIVYVVLSWVKADSPIVDVIDRLCAPLLRPFRKLIPRVGGIDLSPLVFLVLLQVAAIVLAALQAGVLR